mgnify:CR=1 FL=1
MCKNKLAYAAAAAAQEAAATRPREVAPPIMIATSATPAMSAPTRAVPEIDPDVDMGDYEERPKRSKKWLIALVAVLVVVAKFVATRPPIAEVLERWEHILFPIVLIGLGIAILVGGGAFGL